MQQDELVLVLSGRYLLQTHRQGPTVNNWERKMEGREGVKPRCSMSHLQALEAVNGLEVEAHCPPSPIKDCLPLKPPPCRLVRRNKQPHDPGVHRCGDWLDLQGKSLRLARSDSEGQRRLRLRSSRPAGSRLCTRPCSL